MKVFASVCGFAFALLAAPAFAQIADAEIDALMKRWVAAFNKGDTAALAKDVYAIPDEAALNKTFQDLRADSFGKLDVYDFKACPIANDRTIVRMNYARIYTFGGKMNEDESKMFVLARTQAGWRISLESDVAFGKELVC